MTHLRKMMLEELQRRHYSHRTAKTYVRIVRDFAQHFHCVPNQLGPEQIRQYQAHLFQAKKLAPATVSQYASALRFFFVKTLRRRFLAEHIPFPKQPRRLPTVLSPEEVARLIDSANNLYHRTLLMTLYSTGMRRAELCRLNVSDIDSRRMMIRIQQGKGRRDREVPLSPKLVQALRVYWRRWRSLDVRNHADALVSPPCRHTLLCGAPTSSLPVSSPNPTALSPLSASLPSFKPVSDWHSNPIAHRVRRKRQRLPPSLLIENASGRLFLLTPKSPARGVSDQG